MKCMIPWVVLAALAVGGLAGCATDDPQVLEQPETRAVKESGWPFVPCPPDDPIHDAWDRLSDIRDWAWGDNRDEIAELAEKCRSYHEYGEDHQPPAVEMSLRIHKAFKRAKAALATEDPEIRDRRWLACKEQLEHDP